MKTTAVCFMVLVVGFHSLNAISVADLDNHLKETMDKLVENLKSKGVKVFLHMGNDIVEGMNISDSLVAAGLITPEAAAQKMLISFENFVLAHVIFSEYCEINDHIWWYAELVCNEKGFHFSFQPAVVEKYPTYISEMNKGMKDMCNHLGLPVDPVHEQYALSSPWIVSSECSAQFNSSSTAKANGLILVTCTFGVFTN